VVNIQKKSPTFTLLTVILLEKKLSKPKQIWAEPIRDNTGKCGK